MHGEEVIGRALVVLAGMAAAFPALSEPTTLGALRGKIKPGLYEKATEADLPGKNGKHRSTRQDCMDDAYIDTFAEDENPECKTADFRLTDTGATYRSSCKRGTHDALTENELTFEEGGYTMVTRTTFQVPGKPVVVVQRYKARYLGACPAK